MNTRLQPGEHYPELRNATIQTQKMELHEMQPPNWNLPRDQMFAEWRTTAQTRVVDAVRVTMPEEDWARLMSIYTAHYHAASRNPAVQEAWQQYKMLVTLTQT